MTNRTRDLLVLVCREREYRDEAEGEPGPAGDAVGGPVAAVVALGGGGFEAGEGGCEFYRGG